MHGTTLSPKLVYIYIYMYKAAGRRLSIVHGIAKASI